MRLVFLGVLCASPAAARELYYTFQPEVRGNALIVHTVLEFPGPPSDPAKLVRPSTWGDATGLEKGIANLASGHHHGRVRVTYDVVKDWVTPPSRPDHHVIVEPQYFEFNTQNALVHPEIRGTDRVDVRLDFTQLPPCWKLVTSFGTARRQRFRGTWSHFRDVLFAAGDFRTYRRGGLLVAIRSQWRISDEDMVARIQKVFDLERTFWRDHRFPYYLVTVAPFGRESGSSGGSAFINAFAVFPQQRSQFGYEFQSLLAHEMFHEWNPYRMGERGQSSKPLAWFTEGFTSYYQDLLLYRGGVLPWPDYLDHVNTILRGAATEPSPYSRGASIALWVNWAIGQASGGERSLDNVMRDLVSQRNARRARLDAERVFAAAAQYLDPAGTQQFRDFALSDKALEVPDGALGECAERALKQVARFDLGFDREALENRHVVEGVREDSAAYRAGIRNGQRVSRTSVYWNDVNKPVKLTVGTPEGNKNIEYLPHGAFVATVPQFHARACGKLP